MKFTNTDNKTLGAITLDSGMILKEDIKVINDYVAIPLELSEAEHSRLQQFYRYITNITEPNSSNEFKERAVTLLIPYDANGIIDFDKVTCCISRLFWSQDQLEDFIKLVVKNPQLQIDVVMQPIEKLHLVSNMILRKAG